MPQKKAIELIEFYLRVKIYKDGESFYMTWYSARECARIAVDQILKVSFSDYWKEVRKEL